VVGTPAGDSDEDHDGLRRLISKQTFYPKSF
jgi:hypothetical protein